MDDPVADVLERVHHALEDVVHVLLLDPEDRVVVADDDAPADVLATARSLATTLAVAAAAGAPFGVLEAGERTYLATYAPGTLAAVLVGPPGWNVALARRTAEPLLRSTLTVELTDRVRAGRPAAPAAPGRGTRAAAVRADAIRHVPRA